MTEIPPISHCVGDYEPDDSVCNGDGKEDPPCSWKDRCEAFQRHLKQTGEDVEKYVVPREIPEEDGTVIAEPINGPKKFAAFCDKLIKKEVEAKRKEKAKAERKNKKIAKRYDKRRKGPKSQTKRAAKKALTARAKSRRNYLIKIFELFKAELVRNFPDREFATYGSVVFPGQFYAVNRIESSDYIALYCRSLKGWDQGIGFFRFRTASLTFDVRLSVTLDEFRSNVSAAMFKELDPQPLEKCGRFKIIIKRVGKIEVGLLAEAIAKMANNGIISLPAKQDD